MTVNSLLNSYRSALPSSSGSSWPADGRDIDTATATSLTVNGTSVTLDRFDGYTLDTEGAYPIVVSNPIRLRLELWGGGGGGSSGGAAGSAGGWIAGDMVLSAGTYWLLVAGGGVYSTGLPAFPDSSTTSESSGGGSSRFGPASTYLTANQVHTKGNGFNNSNAVYWLIAGGGGGGSNHATTEDTLAEVVKVTVGDSVEQRDTFTMAREKVVILAELVVVNLMVARQVLLVALMHTQMETVLSITAAVDPVPVAAAVTTEVQALVVITLREVADPLTTIQTM